MGAGKTAIGRRVASQSSLPFVDLDHAIEAAAGMTVAEIFDKLGESGFRKLEHQALRAHLAGPPAVLSLGGGALCSDDALALIDGSHRLVWLRVSPEIAAARLETGRAKRPLLGSDDPVVTLRRLLASRERYYAHAEFWLDTDDRSIAAVAGELSRRLETLPEPLTVELGPRSYPIHFSYGGASGVGARVAPHCETGRVFVVTDDNVGPLYLTVLCHALKARGLSVTSETVAAGETSKSAHALEQLYDAFIERGGDRKTPIVALGGGVVGDLAGFAAATLLRGVPLIQVPTTLLAQVDSAVGGKTGVNHRLGKNLIGAFYQPRAVICDPTFLQTLPDREYTSGLAEVIKYGAIADLRLFATIEDNLERILRREHQILATIIKRCLQIKAEIVARDERDQGDRALLNYGHTLGHAIETQTAYRSHLHGEAVALGMVWINACAPAIGSPEKEDYAERIRGLLQQCQLPVSFEKYKIPDVVDHASRDKKRRGDRIELIILERLGRARRLEVDYEKFQRAALTAE